MTTVTKDQLDSIEILLKTEVSPDVLRSVEEKYSNRKLVLNKDSKLEEADFNLFSQSAHSWRRRARSNCGNDKVKPQHRHRSQWTRRMSAATTTTTTSSQPKLRQQAVDQSATTIDLQH